MIKLPTLNIKIVNIMLNLYNNIGAVMTPYNDFKKIIIKIEYLLKVIFFNIISD